jgi:hypothetical protein
MPHRPHVLAAFPPFALERVIRIFGGSFALVPVTSFDAAQEKLKTNPHVALVLCGVHFDESRMYDLLRYVRGELPRLPFVCCRVLSSEIPAISREAIELAATTLGASVFIDVPTLSQELGNEQADEQFRSLVLAQLPRRNSENGQSAVS